MKEIKITIPDNCELIKEGNSYIIKEKYTYPKSWEEFCDQYPITDQEYFIDASSAIGNITDTLRRLDRKRRIDADRNMCISKKEAEAFLALMQLRQLRKAWVGDWKPSEENYYAICYSIYEEDEPVVARYSTIKTVLSFPTEEMAEEFLECFRDLCETAKILL